MAAFEKICSGLEGLDVQLQNIRFGDNVVWQVSSMEDYLFFVKPFCIQAVKDRRNIIYMHFTGHPQLIEPQQGIQTYEFDPMLGFESFAVAVRKRIAQEGREAFYVFDCLSELQVAWATDLMMGNFFQVTCPYLFELDTVSYFPILRGRHSYEAIARLRETTQIFLDVYMEESLYLNPLKVWNRYSDTMFLPHQYHPEDGAFCPLKEGLEISRFFALADRHTNTLENQNLDSWERFVAWSKMEYQAGRFTRETMEHFSHNMMSRDKKVLKLLEQYFTPEDYFTTQSRMIGTGGIGGKACGMLLARKIIQRDCPNAYEYMEQHDSYYVGSDVFYTYIVHNGFWRLRIKQKKKEGFFARARELQEALRKGKFPVQIQDQFVRMLEYFGQCPIIVRSSSLQEDGFGNAFAGKYESVFCINIGSIEDRLHALEQAVRAVYASTMDVSALEYRRQRGLEDRDEQMAILIQRVSGTRYEDFFMPHAAGVGYSHSAYKWSGEIDASVGMLRLVMGLGTRAVDRTEGDYPRIVSLDAPEKTTLVSSMERHRFSQNYVDVMDYHTLGLNSRPVSELIAELPAWYQKLVLEHDVDAEAVFRERGQKREVLFASCCGLVRNEAYIQCMKRVLRTLQTAYQYPVDIEFTVNGSKTGDFVFNLLQCRPLQMGSDQGEVQVPSLAMEKTVFQVKNASMGGSRKEKIDIVVWVDPRAYYQYPYRDKHKIAHGIGMVNRYYKEQSLVKSGGSRKLMLFTPGRLGTSSPDLGVPVVFADINHFSAVCEVSDSSTGYMPELSYGSHMFQDLVEMETFYTAIFENESTEYFNREFFGTRKNILEEILPGLGELTEIIKVYNLSGENLMLYSDVCNEHTVLGIE